MQRDLRVLHRLRHVRVDAFLVDDDALDELGVADGAADLLLDLDVIDVDLAVLVDDCLDRLDAQVGELLAHCLGALAGHCGDWRIP